MMQCVYNSLLSLIRCITSYMCPQVLQLHENSRVSWSKHVKLKVTLEQATKAQRGSRGTAPLFP
jgi:hypothetical protein